MGLVYLMLYVLVVGTGTFLMKFVMSDLTPYQLNFLIAIGMVIITVPALLIAQGNFSVPVKTIPLGIVIGLLFTIGTILFIFSLTKLAVGPATAISTGYVVVAVILSIIFLKERPDPITVLGMVLAIAGIAILSFKTS